MWVHVYIDKQYLLITEYPEGRKWHPGALGLGSAEFLHIKMPTPFHKVVHSLHQTERVQYMKRTIVMNRVKVGCASNQTEHHIEQKNHSPTTMSPTQGIKSSSCVL